MKFVHIADMHFDTSFAQISNTELGNSRRLEQRKDLKKIIEYIKENNIKNILFLNNIGKLDDDLGILSIN